MAWLVPSIMVYHTSGSSRVNKMGANTPIQRSRLHYLFFTRVKKLRTSFHFLTICPFPWVKFVEPPPPNVDKHDPFQLSESDQLIHNASITQSHNYRSSQCKKKKKKKTTIYSNPFPLLPHPSSNTLETFSSTKAPSRKNGF